MDTLNGSTQCETAFSNLLSNSTCLCKMCIRTASKKGRICWVCRGGGLFLSCVGDELCGLLKTCSHALGKPDARAEL